MTIIKDIYPSWQNNVSDASRDVDGSNGQRGDRLSWSITVNDGTVANANLVHKEAAQLYGFQVGGLHPTDDFLLANSIRVTRHSPIYFMLESTFRVEGAEPGSSPLDEPPTIETDTASSVEALDTDIDGDPMVTVNGEGFDPPLTDEIHDLVLTVTRNLPSWDPLLAWTYMGAGRRPSATNSDEFLGFPPGAAKMRRLHAKSVEQENFIYFQATAVVQFRNAMPEQDIERAWWQRVRHEGFLAKFVNPFDPNEFVIDRAMINGVEATKPVLLKADGQMIDYNDQGEPDLDQVNWLEFQTSPALPFNALGFF